MTSIADCDLEFKLEMMAPGLGDLLKQYTRAVQMMAEAQAALTEFISDKPEIQKKFELIGEISQTVGQQLSEEEIMGILTE